MNATEILNTLIEKKDLTSAEARQFLLDVMEGVISPVQTGAILTAFRMKGESAAEVKGLIQAMREKMISINAPGAVDIVGTGGDGYGTFNISTASSFVARGAGAKVAKHGNRAASGKCGSADVLEALGVKIDISPEKAQKVFDKIGIIFMFAPIYHPSMKQVIAVRRELKIRTVFNVLGPFTNPARTERQLTGVLNKETAEKMANVAKDLGYKHLVIVSSLDGMDKISISAKTDAYEVRGKSVKKFKIDPSKLGFKKAPKSELLGAGKEENAEIIRAILRGEKGPKRDIVVLNAAFGLYVAGIAKTPKEGIALAEHSLNSGAGSEALERLIKESNAV